MITAAKRKKIRRPTSAWIARACPECGAGFSVPPNQVKHGRGVYCGPKCRSAAGGRAYHLKHDTRGEANPRFKGDEALTKYEHKKRFQERHPKKAAAHAAVHAAVRSGRLAKGPCEACGAIDDVHAHHDDYDKPLEVRWLCGRHHRMHHGASS